MAVLMPALSRAWNALRTRLENPQRGRYNIFGRNNAQVRVTPEIALMVSAINACIDCVAKAMSSSDWNVYSGTRGLNDQQFLPQDGLQYVLNTRMNPEMTAQSGKRSLMIAALGWGNGYAEIVRDMAGRIVEMWPLAPDRNWLKRSYTTGQLYLEVHNDYGEVVAELDMRDVFHIRGPGISGILGDNTFAKAVQTVAMSVALDQFSAAYFANGAQMGVVLEYPGLGKMDDPTYQRLKESWGDRHAGARQAFRTGFLDGGMKLHQISIEAEKAQMVEARYQQIEECCRWFGVPPHKIGHLARSTNNNIEHQGLEFSRDTLRPWKFEIEQEADYKLVPARGARRFVVIDTDWAAEGDFKSRMEGFAIGRNMGIYETNDILRKLGENTISREKGGELRIVNGAAIPLERVGENYQATAGQPVQPGAPEVGPAEGEDDDSAADEILEDWTRSVFARLGTMMDRCREKHLGQNDGELRAQMEGMTYCDRALQEVEASLVARWPSASDQLKYHGLRVVRGTDPDVACADLFQSLKGKQ